MSPSNPVVDPDVAARVTRKQGLMLDAPTPPPSGPTGLNVALYPYVPQPAWFQTAVTNAWNARKTGITLNWFNYDCYSALPPNTLDVFAFDAIYSADFIHDGILQPFSGVGVDDYFCWALAGLQAGDQIYGAPYLGCMNVLIYWASDQELDAPGLNNAGLVSVLKASPDTGAEPPLCGGLVVDFMGATTDACLYLQTIMENTGEFGDPCLGPASKPNCDALADLTNLVSMAGWQQATYCDAGEQRLLWFAGESGRAFVGLTETLGAMANDQVAGFRFRPLPAANAPVTQIPTFTDALGINAHLDAGKLETAAAFVNMATGYDVMMASLTPPSVDDTPQYLIPARQSVLTALGSYDPYKRIQSLFAECPPQPFRIGVGARDWLQQQAAKFRWDFIGSPKTCTPPPDAAFASSPAGIWRRGWA